MNNLTISIFITCTQTHPTGKKIPRHKNLVRALDNIKGQIDKLRFIRRSDTFSEN